MNFQNMKISLVSREMIKSKPTWLLQRQTAG